MGVGGDWDSGWVGAGPPAVCMSEAVVRGELIMLWVLDMGDGNVEVLGDTPLSVGKMENCEGDGVKPTRGDMVDVDDNETVE